MKLNITDKKLLLLAGILVALVLLFLYNAHFLFPDLSMSFSSSSPKASLMPFRSIGEFFASWVTSGD